MSRKVVGTLTAAEMLAEIDSATVVIKPADPEWLTVSEWKEQWGVSDSVAGRSVRKAVAAGLMQTRKDFRRRVTGEQFRTHVYKYVGKCKPNPPQLANRSAKRSRN